MTLHRVAVLLCLGLGGVEPGAPRTGAVRHAGRRDPAVRAGPAAGRPGRGGHRDRQRPAPERLGRLPAHGLGELLGQRLLRRGTPRVDPATGQIISGNTSNRSLSTSLSASVDLFTGFRRGAGDPGRPGEPGRGRSLVRGRPLPAGAHHHQPVPRRAGRGRQLVRVREASVRRAEEQLKIVGRQAPGRARPRGPTRCARW